MDRNPHVHTYRDTGLPRDRSHFARSTRAAMAAAAAAWRRGVPGRLVAAADTFGAVATWMPRWRQRVTPSSHAWRQRDAWPYHRQARTSAAITAARIRQEQRRAALDRQARARAA
jgi:hypothetical protein